ncbi:MAG: hypothetical protein JNM43_11525 [Planctomycetaceae bacterium]|nr:hypothetical protein [Planctomycetaceae bacterium]
MLGSSLLGNDGVTNKDQLTLAWLLPDSLPASVSGEVTPGAAGADAVTSDAAGSMDMLSDVGLLIPTLIAPHRLVRLVTSP